MNWNAEQLQARFHQQTRKIEADIDGLKIKMKDNDNYERFHDEELGKLHLYILIENTINLMSKDLFINYLQKLRDDGPGIIKEAIIQSRAIDGWRNEINFLIKEYG